MWRIERHQRREAVAPVGDVLQRLAVGGFVRVIDGEFRTDGPRIGQRQADRKSGAGSRLVDGIEQQRVVVLGDDDLREVNLRVAAG